MIIPAEYLTEGLALSVSINLALGYYCYLLKKRSKHKKLDQTAQELLAEIMSGPAVVKVDLVERDSIIQWRPGG